MEIQKLILNSDYNTFLQEIINSRGQWNPPTKYWEGHHIIPKCLGGLGNPRQQHTNIIHLTAAEHFTAHKLLAELFPDNSKLVYAFWAMCTCSETASIATAEEYELVRVARSKTIGKDVQVKLIGSAANEQVRKNHSLAQTGELNGFFGKAHSIDSRKKLAKSASKPVIHVNTGKIYSSSYEAADELGISRVLINNCCRGKQASTKGGMCFKYVNPLDLNRGVLNKSSLTRYDRRRKIIELRKVVLNLNEAFPGILAPEDTERIRKLATCENKRYLLELLNMFVTALSTRDIKEYLNDTGIDDELRAIIRDL